MNDNIFICEFCGNNMPHKHDTAIVEVIKMMGSIQSSQSLNQTIRMNELETRIAKLENIIRNLGENAFDLSYMA